jgi:hypothetical protein
VARIDRRVYDRYVGQYKFNSKHFLAITDEGDRLMARDSEQKGFPFELIPESETEFFLTAVDAQVSFVTNEAGVVMQAIVHQNGKDAKAEKVK